MATARGQNEFFNGLPGSIGGGLVQPACTTPIAPHTLFLEFGPLPTVLPSWPAKLTACFAAGSTR